MQYGRKWYSLFILIHIQPYINVKSIQFLLMFIAFLVPSFLNSQFLFTSKSIQNHLLILFYFSLLTKQQQFLMKSPFFNTILHTKDPSTTHKPFSQKLKRFTTLPQTYTTNNPQSSHRILRKASINPSSGKDRDIHTEGQRERERDMRGTWSEKHSRKLSGTGTGVSMETKREDWSANERSLPNKYGIQLVSNMSGKSYGDVAGYGWAQLRAKEKERERQKFCGNYSIFTINLGKIKNFILVQLSQSPINPKISMKDLCQNYITQLSSIIYSQTPTQQSLKNTILQLNSTSMYKNHKFSILIAVIGQEQTTIISYGNGGALVCTRGQELVGIGMGLTCEVGVQIEKRDIFLDYGVRSNRYQKISNRLVNKSLSIKTETHAQTLSPNKSFYSDAFNNSLSLPKFHTKTFKTNQLFWLTLLTSKLSHHYTHSPSLIKQFLNKQISLTSWNTSSSNSYSFGQATMEACKKMINKATSQGGGAGSQWMTAIGVAIGGYPWSNIDGEKGLRVGGNGGGESRIWEKLRNNRNQSAQKQKEEQETNRPKLLKYVGNRRSFIKNAIQLQNKDQKRKLLP